MKIERIVYLTPNLVMQIMQMARKVEGAPFTAEEYAEYISRNFDRLGLFGCFEDEKLVSYIHAEPPHSLDKKKGYITMAVADPKYSTQSKTMLRIAELWMKELGATSWYCHTRRQVKGFIKKFKLRLENDEAIIGKDI
jgi:hypothetical protein